MQFVTLSEKYTKNTIRKHISQAFFWCLCRNWQVMLGCPFGGCFVATLTTAQVHILAGQQLSSTHTAPATCKRREDC
jgi:hypothetical protein